MLDFTLFYDLFVLLVVFAQRTMLFFMLLVKLLDLVLSPILHTLLRTQQPIHLSNLLIEIPLIPCILRHPIQSIILPLKLPIALPNIQILIKILILLSTLLILERNRRN